MTKENYIKECIKRNGEYSKLPIFKSIYSRNVLIHEEILKDSNILLNHLK